MVDYHVLKLAHLPGECVEVYVCDDCGAIVGHTAQHNAWHEKQHSHDLDINGMASAAVDPRSSQDAQS